MWQSKVLRIEILLKSLTWQNALVMSINNITKFILDYFSAIFTIEPCFFMQPEYFNLVPLM